MHIVMIASKLKSNPGNDFEFSQRTLLIGSTISYFCTAADTQTKVHSVLMASKDQPKFALHFYYMSVTSALTCLAQTSRPDIMYAVRQFARFSANPRESHDEEILYSACYLMTTRDLDIHFQPDPTRGYKRMALLQIIKAMNHVCELQGVGPATASSIGHPVSISA